MGNHQTTQSRKLPNGISINNYVKISAKHKKQQLQKNIKSCQNFSIIIKSIALRASYLNYSWSKTLCYQITHNQDLLYELYLQMFRDSQMYRKRDDFFSIPSYQENFYQEIIAKDKINIELITDQYVQSVFQEVKCFIMVKGWFRELPINTCQKRKFSAQQSKQSSFSQKFSKKSKQSQSLRKQQKLPYILTKLSALHFSLVYQDISQSSLSLNQLIKDLNEKQTNLIKWICKESDFKIREHLVYQLLKEIRSLSNEYLRIQGSQENRQINENQEIQENQRKQQDQENQQDQKGQHNLQIINKQGQKIKATVAILGLKRVYPIIRVLKQIGEDEGLENIQFAFQYIKQNYLKPRKILQSQFDQTLQPLYPINRQLFREISNQKSSTRVHSTQKRMKSKQNIQNIENRIP